MSLSGTGSGKHSPKYTTNKNNIWYLSVSIVSTVIKSKKKVKVSLLQSETEFMGIFGFFSYFSEFFSWTFFFINDHQMKYKKKKLFIIQVEWQFFHLWDFTSTNVAYTRCCVKMWMRRLHLFSYTHKNKNNNCKILLNEETKRAGKWHAHILNVRIDGIKIGSTKAYEPVAFLP